MSNIVWPAKIRKSDWKSLERHDKIFGKKEARPAFGKEISISVSHLPTEPDSYLNLILCRKSDTG